MNPVLYGSPDTVEGTARRFAAVVDELWAKASQALFQTDDRIEVQHLHFAIHMLQQAQAFAGRGDCDTSWVRLIGALDSLRMTRVAGPDIETLRCEIDDLVGIARPLHHISFPRPLIGQTSRFAVA